MGVAHVLPVVVLKVSPNRVASACVFPLICCIVLWKEDSCGLVTFGCDLSCETPFLWSYRLGILFA